MTAAALRWLVGSVAVGATSGFSLNACSSTPIGRLSTPLHIPIVVDGMSRKLIITPEEDPVTVAAAFLQRAGYDDDELLLQDLVNVIHKRAERNIRSGGSHQ